MQRESEGRTVPINSDNSENIRIAQAVILQEASALHLLSASLDKEFSRAIEVILSTKGRVVISGLGKSGHIGRKIAATLAATGTPSFFLHASEATHGDLGMLVEGDILIAISNSGQTRELIPLAAHAKAIGVTIIAIVARANSPLAQSADIVLLLPAAPEACPEKIAPTTSTTMTLALGDALAISTMVRRGVGRESLVKWHPSGSIGNRLSPVEDLLDSRRPLPLVALDAPARDAIFEMTSVGKGVVGVIGEHGDLVGVITDGDLRRSFQQVFVAKARDIMSANPITVPVGTVAEEVLALMNQAKITVVFMMDRDHPKRPIGLIHIHDLGAII